MRGRVPITFALALAGCGPPLGSYAPASVTLVSSEQFQRIGGNERSEIAAPRMLRVELLSSTNVARIKDVTPGNLYVHADFCPYRDGDFQLFGPYFGDNAVYGPARLEGSTAVSDERSPPWDPKRRGYVYTVYLTPYQRAEPATKPGQIEIKGYDLRTDTRDLCMRVTQVGYFVTPSQSKVFVIPRTAIARALGLAR